MSTSEKLSGLVDSLVIPDRASAPGSVDAEATGKILTSILAGGKEAVVGLVELIDEPGKKNDSKARYALHALAVRVGAAKDEPQRRAFGEALASTLGGARPRAVQAFVLRELQVVGGPEAADALGKVLLDEELCEPATQALLAIKKGAVEQFRSALPKAEGKARLNIVQALGVLRAVDSAAAVRKLASDRDWELRVVAVWALANMGTPEAVDVLLKATDAEGYERTRAAGACLLLAERLQAEGHKAEAEKVYTHLREKFTAPHEAHIREAAARGSAVK
jgi:hypothetical protein